MDTERYLKVFDLERDGKLEDGYRLLVSLTNESHPLALVELGTRHISTEGRSPPVLSIAQDPQKGRELIEKGKLVLEDLASKGDGEGMRMLAYLHLGLLGIYEKSIEKAETLLLNAFEAGCYFAANDLHTFYLGSDKEKSKHYYKEAERHRCRVVFNQDFET